MDLIALIVLGRLIYRYVHTKTEDGSEAGDAITVDDTHNHDDTSASGLSQLDSKQSSSRRRMERSLLRKKYSAKQVPDLDIDTIIIGSGMSGLSCAAILSRLGYKVLVLEQHNDVAGKSTSMRLDDDDN